MPTTTATLTLTSSDLTSSGLSITTVSTLLQAGSPRLGLTDTSGLARKTTASTAQYTLFYADDYTADKASKIYIKNLSTTASEYVEIAIDDEVMGRLYAQDFAFFPWSATNGTREVVTLTFGGTWTASDTLAFDGVTVTCGSGTSASATNMRAATFPNWDTSGSGNDCIFTAKRSRADQEIDDTEFTITDASGSDASISVATTTNGLDDAGNIKITPSVATSMTLEYMLINE